MPDGESDPQSELPEPAAEAPADEAAPEEAAPALDPAHESQLARLQAELGDDVLAWASNHGNLVVRVRNQGWGRVATVAKEKLGCDYLSFISGIDWMPAPRVIDPGATSTPSQPDETTYGVTGSDGRFQVFACVPSPSTPHELIFMTAVEGDSPRVASWTGVYPGADWHERVCWEMFGIVFDGHPHLQHLYLPGEFEGHPLRKDFPLLARELNPWPGLVDVELMPESPAADEPASAAVAPETPDEPGAGA